MDDFGRILSKCTCAWHAARQQRVGEEGYGLGLELSAWAVAQMRQLEAFKSSGEGCAWQGVEGSRQWGAATPIAKLNDLELGSSI